jgi:hypothetical protein
MKCEMAADQVSNRFSRQIRKEDALRTGAVALFGSDAEPLVVMLVSGS